MMQNKGFTLIELLIVVIIIGVLAGIAYPSYQRWTVETRRSDAHIALSQLANDLEKFYSECSTYTSSIAPSPPSPRSCTTPSGGTLGRKDDYSPSRHYRLSIQLVSGGGYTLTATPQGHQATTDTDCKNLTLTHTGQTGASGPNKARCWRR